MPKARKTLEKLVESGTYQRNVGRYAPRIAAMNAIARPIGNAPSHLTPTEREVWKELVQMAPDGLLQRSDRLCLEVACKLTAHVRSNGAKISDVSILMNVLGKLGFTPIDRLKLNLEPPPPKASATSEPDPWDEF